MRRPLPPPSVLGRGRRRIEAFLCVRLERIDWMAQAEQLKQQMLATLSDRDQQLRQLTAMLEEARRHKPKPQQDQYQREVGVRALTISPTPCSTHESSLRSGLPSGYRGGGHCSRSAAAAEPVRGPRPPSRDQRAAEKVPHTWEISNRRTI